MKLPILKSIKSSVQLKGFSDKQKERINKILSKIPQGLVQKVFSKIELDNELANTSSKFKSYGKYNKVTKELRVNPAVFNSEDFKDKDDSMTKLEHTIFHELGHGIDEIYKFSDDPKWLKMSGWEQNYKGTDKKRLVIPTDNGNIESAWYYDPSSDFPRWYASRSPKDDFAECAAFILGGLEKRFKNRDKVNYINQKISELKIKHTL